MNNFEGLVAGLKATGDAELPGFQNVPLLPERIQHMAENQFSAHWQRTEEGGESNSECGEKQMASEIKVSQWLEGKIDKEWKKQFFGDLANVEDEDAQDGNGAARQ